SRLDALRSRPAPLIGDLGWGRSIIFAALVLAVPPFVAWLVGTLLQGDLPVQLLSSATATLSVIAVWARSATGAVAKVDAAITKVVEAYTARLAEDPGVLRATETLRTTRSTAETAEATLAAARAELARAE